MVGLAPQSMAVDVIAAKINHYALEVHSDLFSD